MCELYRSIDLYFYMQKEHELKLKYKKILLLTCLHYFKCDHIKLSIADTYFSYHKNNLPDRLGINSSKTVGIPCCSLAEFHLPGTYSKDTPTARQRSFTGICRCGF